MKPTIRCDGTIYDSAAAEAGNRKKGLENATETRAAAESIRMDDEPTDLRAEAAFSPTSGAAPPCKPDCRDRYCGDGPVQNKQVEKCVKCDTWSDEVPDNWKSETGKETHFADNKRVPAAMAFKEQEYNYAKYKKAAKGRRKHFATLFHDRTTGQYTYRVTKGVIIGDIGLEWRRSSLGMCWYPTHIPTGICFADIRSFDMHEAYVFALNTVNMLSKNPQAAGSLLKKTGA